MVPGGRLGGRLARGSWKEVTMDRYDQYILYKIWSWQIIKNIVSTTETTTIPHLQYVAEGYLELLIPLLPPPEYWLRLQLGRPHLFTHVEMDPGFSCIPHKHNWATAPGIGNLFLKFVFLHLLVLGEKHGIGSLVLSSLVAPIVSRIKFKLLGLEFKTHWTWLKWTDPQQHALAFLAPFLLLALRCPLAWDGSLFLSFLSRPGSVSFLQPLSSGVWKQEGTKTKRSSAKFWAVLAAVGQEGWAVSVYIGTHWGPVHMGII